MSEEDEAPRYEANPAGPFRVLFVVSFAAFLAAIFLRMFRFEGLSMIPVAAFAIGAATSLFWIFRLTDKRTKRVRNERRFGANGAVLNEMSDALRQDYERASFNDYNRHLPALVSVGLIMAIMAVGAASRSTPTGVLSWWLLPGWLLPALGFAALPSALVPALQFVRKQRQGQASSLGTSPRSRVTAIAIALPLGVAIAAVADAVQQYHALG